MNGTKRVLYLDIDGVLNTTRCNFVFGKEAHTPFPNMPETLKYLDPIGVNFIKRLSELGVEVIMSSTWRIGIDMEMFMRETGIKIAGVTPRRADGSRAIEIMEHLYTYSDEILWVVLDDDSRDSDLYLGHFVRTDYGNGITWEAMLRVINILQIEMLL